MDGKGYPIPDPVDPGEMTCFRVYVPKDTKYIGAFWAAYEFFTSWLAWARDPLRRGKQAAAVWRRSFDKARQEYERSGGLCEMNITGIRQNPLNPCDLQAEFDGNNQWITVADLSKCGGGGAGSLPVMRYDGVNIQIYNDCSGEWENTGQPTTPATTPIPIPYPTSPPDGACNAAASYAEQVYSLYHDWLSVLAPGYTIGQWITKVLAGISILSGQVELTGVSAKMVELYEDATARAEDALLLDPRDTLRCLSLPYFAADGTMTSANNDLLLGDLVDMRDSFDPASADYIVWTLIEWLTRIVGRAGIAKSVLVGAITDADCSDCEWQYIFDFEASRAAWFARPEWDGTGGAWDYQYGWRPTVFHTTGNTGKSTIIRTMLPSTTITQIKFVYDAIEGSNQPNPDQNALYIGKNGSDTDLLFDDMAAGVDKVAVWNGSEVMTEIRVGIQVGREAGNVADPGGSGYIKRAIIRGAGTNPFV